MKMFRPLAVFAFVMAIAGCAEGGRLRPRSTGLSSYERDGLPPVATLSVVGFDPGTGDLGVAVPPARRRD